MAARPTSARRSLPRILGHPFRSVLCAVASTLGLASLAHAVDGKWTPFWDWRGDTNAQRYAIHLILVPGDGTTHHSRILWFRGEDGTEFEGGEWKWSSGNEGCVEFPIGNFASLPIDTSGVDLFCAGHAGLSDGRILLPGGSDFVTGSYGENRARVYERGTGSAASTWSNPGEMVEWRWYPSATTLKDGRVFVGGGSRHRHHRVFGGKRDGAPPSSPNGDKLHRFAPVDNGAWEPELTPAGDPLLLTPNDRPSPRFGHTFVEMTPVVNIFSHVLFGGRGTDGGAPSNDTWFLKRADNRLGADYAYSWTKALFSGTAPFPRSDHTAVVALDKQMVIFGGLGENGALFNDVHRFAFDSGFGLRWLPMTISGTPPSARCGHAAFYEVNSVAGQEVKRMIVFGGTTAPGQPHSDRKIYELRFNDATPNNATWTELTQVDLSPGVTDEPGPRHWHTLTHDPSVRTGPGNRLGHATFLFGGRLDANAYSDSLWVLWTFQDGTVGWERKSYGEEIAGARPSARARHSAVLDPNQGRDQSAARLYIYGGENAAGPVDADTHVLDPWAAGSPQWEKWQQQGFTLSGHTAVLDYELTHARIPEVFSATGGSPQAYTNHPHYWHHTYPLNFAVSGSTTPGGRLLTVGQDPLAHWLDLPAPGQQPASGWQTISPALDAGFVPQTGVMYLPGKIMIAGGVHSLTGALVNTTKTLDVTNLAAGWQNSALVSALSPRHFHNLVALPDGKVMAVGGYASTSQTGHAFAEKRPQIWDPAGENGIGSWTPAGQLAEQTETIRGYHSTAILLPDGRVLSSSGEGHADKYKTNMYCPQYLYKDAAQTQLAARPTFTAPTITSLAWGDTFTVCTPTAAQIQKVSLVRAAATTHTFDENQRFVPLGFTFASSPDRLIVNAPASADHAPPGYYMVFLVGSADGPDVPSIAKWVRIGVSQGRDTCDTVVPAAPYNLLATCEPGTQNTWRIRFTAPADDGTLPASGSVTEYDLRVHTSPITDANWSAATPLTAPPPGGPATIQLTDAFTIEQRSYVRIKAKDDNLGLSVLSAQVTLPYPTDCSGLAGGGGGGGGGSSARRVADGASLTPASDLPAGRENSLLHALAFGQAGTDHLRLPGLVRSADGGYSAVIRAIAGSAADLDHVGLLAVDHAPGEHAFVAAGVPVAGPLAPATRAVNDAGADVTAALAGSGEPLVVDAGAALIVDLPGEPGTPAPLVIDASGQSGPDGGILVQVADAAGTWATVGRVHPRRDFDAQLVDAVPSRVRLEFLSPHAVRWVGRLSPSPAPPRATWLEMQAAETELLGDVAAPLAGQDALVAPLVGPDAIALSFAGTDPEPNRERTCFLVVNGTPLSPRQVDPAWSRSLPARVPEQLALRPGPPNPSAHEARIVFELPRGQVVRLEVLDPQGRRVRVLSNAYHPAGVHTATWDLRDDVGHRVQPGIHFCRIVAGAHRATVKLAVMP